MFGNALTAPKRCPVSLKYVGSVSRVGLVACQTKIYQRRIQKIRLKDFVNEKARPKHCLRCNTRMSFAGSKQFHEGPKLGALGDFAELFIGQTRLEMYVCPNCLQVEFFLADR
jgi:hypothetical protein